jgi:hypothetical protein
MTNRFALKIVLIILALPILLPIFNPSLHLGGWGLLLGAMAYTISPLALVVVIILVIIDLLRKPRNSQSTKEKK